MVAGNNEHLGGTPMLVISQAVVLLIVPAFVWQGLKLIKSADSHTSSIAIADGNGNQEDAVPQPTGGASEGCKGFGKQLWLLVEGVRRSL